MGEMVRKRLPNCHTPFLQVGEKTKINLPLLTLTDRGCDGTTHGVYGVSALILSKDSS